MKNISEKDKAFLARETKKTFEKDKAFLAAGDFPKFSSRGLYCHVKLTNPDGGMPKAFGVVFNYTPATVVLIDAHGDATGVKEKFDSIDALLNAGWVVD